MLFRIFNYKKSIQNLTRISYKFFCISLSKINYNFLEIFSPFSEAATESVPYKKIFLNFAIFTKK